MIQSIIFISITFVLFGAFFEANLIILFFKSKLPHFFGVMYDKLQLEGIHSSIKMH